MACLVGHSALTIGLQVSLRAWTALSCRHATPLARDFKSGKLGS